MQTNHLTNPLGFSLTPLSLKYKVKAKQGGKQQKARIRIYKEEENQPLYDSGLREDIDSLAFSPMITLAPRTRYSWDVYVLTDKGNEALSPKAYFETAKLEEPWAGKWIASGEPMKNTRLFKNFALKGKVASARLYICGLGLYEPYLNGKKIGDEFLTPYCNDYSQWLQYQTYDISQMLTEQNQLSVLLGDGWYKGPFGFQGQKSIYGDTQALLCEVHVTYTNGQSQAIISDTSWQAEDSPVRFASIYDGEIYDPTFIPSKAHTTVYENTIGYHRLMPRLSPPVRVMRKINPEQLLQTPCGELVLDLGQIITGYLAFRPRGKKGQEYRLQYGEVLQKGCFYNENLRSAKQEFTYISNGEEEWIRPHFTFYGFRYVKLTGFTNPRLEDFIGCVLYSDMPQTAFLHTSNTKVNRLALNALWGQRGNFLDVPTDCPQRDERMGWTGDAQAFCATACYQMDSAAFFTKYMYDMLMEQKTRQGAVPHVVPSFKMSGSPSCAWADAATIIPWTLYLFYGDKGLLGSQYQNMTDWVEWVYRLDEQTGSRRLWHTGFHFADWLALDADHPSSTIGGTDPHFIASAYYLYSTRLTAKAAKVLGKNDDWQRYEALADEILQAMRNEYITNTGRLAVATQTAYVLALMLDLVTKEEAPQIRAAMERKFENSRGELRTGFVGTPYLCKVLTQNGLGNLAYSLFLREEYPGWLYEVNMGATTIWERWNSILPDGSVSDTGMNSLNHYAYGSVMEWVYQDVAGISPLEEAPGFRMARMAPRMDPRLAQVDFVFDSPVGTYKSAWVFTGNHSLCWTVEVPFGAKAQLVLPSCIVTGDVAMSEAGDFMTATVPSGSYTLYCNFEKLPWAPLPFDVPFATLLADEQIKQIIHTCAPDIDKVFKRTPADVLTLRALRGDSFSLLPPDQLQNLEDAFNKMTFS